MSELMPRIRCAGSREKWTRGRKNGQLASFLWNEVQACEANSLIKIKSASACQLEHFTFKSEGKFEWIELD